MSETRTHVALVAETVRFIEAEFSPSLDISIYVDAAGAPSDSKPPQINGFIPDVFAKAVGESVCIIGEAKTFRDLDREHSLNQLNAYADFLQLFPTGILLIAVPLFSLNYAKALVRMLQLHKRAICVKCIYEGYVRLNCASA